MFPVAEHTGAVTFGNTQTPSIILSHAADFPIKFQASLIYILYYVVCS
jgi:hypothetical protein